MRKIEQLIKKEIDDLWNYKVDLERHLIDDPDNIDLQTKLILTNDFIDLKTEDLEEVN